MTAKSTVKTAFFPGSFRPFTRGHADIVERGLKLFDRIVIGIGINRAKSKADGEAVAENIRRHYADNPAVEVVVYNELTIQAARKAGAQCLLRGVRSVKDFEYERELADINMQLSGMDSVILFSRPELASISSSLVRELEAYGEDVSQLLP
ncbi:MAG: pantetheine-phosphate adenylyltransferase [Muribaculaceae bacterium]|nr:pantetheine-phosphate adenylyltransferase [Muribaculaceae bacterium]